VTLVLGFVWLLAYLVAGHWLSLVLFNGAIPGSVLGLLALFATLMVMPAPKALVTVSEGLTHYLALFFLPAAAGVFFLPEAISQQWLALLVAVVVGTIASIALCALVLKFVAGADKDR
jgi:holin-like protein